MEPREIQTDALNAELADILQPGEFDAWLATMPTDQVVGWNYRFKSLPGRTVFRVQEWTKAIDAEPTLTMQLMAKMDVRLCPLALYVRTVGDYSTVGILAPAGESARDFLFAIRHGAQRGGWADLPPWAVAFVAPSTQRYGRPMTAGSARWWLRKALREQPVRSSLQAVS